MKQVAITFSHNHYDSISAYLDALSKVIQMEGIIGTCRFTIVASPLLVDKLTNKVPGIGVLPSALFNKKNFNYIINSNTILSQADPKHYIKIVQDQIINTISPEKISLASGIVFESIFNACDGYGSSAENLAVALGDKIPFSFKPIEAKPTSVQLANPKLLELIDRFPIGDKYIYYSLPRITLSARQHRQAGARIASLTMFESTKIPKSWVSPINFYDILLVPSTFCHNVFKDCGVTVPIHVTGLGISPERWPINKKRTQADRPFRFLLFANSHWGNVRKNYMAALNMFKKCFSGNPDVELWLKLTVNDYPKDVPPNVRIIAAQYSHKQLVHLLHSCDCLLFPSNGEGFGLPPREAIATGMTSIYTNWGGLTDLADLEVGFPVDPAGTQPANYPDRHLIAMNGGSNNFGVFAKQNTKAICDQMIHVVKNRKSVLDKAIVDAHILRGKETYQHTANKIIHVMEGLQ